MRQIDSPWTGARKRDGHAGAPRTAPNRYLQAARERNALKAVGVSLHDHVIIGRKGHCSLRSMNVIDGWK